MQIEKIKLAEYDLETMKFKKFLELGVHEYWESFVYAGDEIIIGMGSCCTDDQESFDKDEKDPLNRFGGLFDGRTYGEGRFVMVPTILAQKNNISDDKSLEIYREEGIAWLDEIIKVGYSDGNDDYYEEEYILVKETSSEKLFCNHYDSYGDPYFKLLGNVHENPELWEKVK